MQQFNNKNYIFFNYWKNIILCHSFKKYRYKNCNFFFNNKNVILTQNFIDYKDSNNLFTDVFKSWLHFYLFFGKAPKLLHFCDYYKQNSTDERTKYFKISLKMAVKNSFQILNNLYILKKVNYSNLLINLENKNYFEINKNSFFQKTSIIDADKYNSLPQIKLSFSLFSKFNHKSNLINTKKIFKFLILYIL